MTGATLARRLLEEQGIECGVIAGPDNAYHPGEQLITLRPHVYNGRTPRVLTYAAHEVGHAVQAHRLGWIAEALRWVTPGRLWLERDASIHAREMLTGLDIEPDEAALRASWQSYVRPAVRDAVIIAAVLLIYAIRK